MHSYQPSDWDVAQIIFAFLKFSGFLIHIFGDHVSLGIATRHPCEGLTAAFCHEVLLIYERIATSREHNGDEVTNTDNDCDCRSNDVVFSGRN